MADRAAVTKDRFKQMLRSWIDQFAVTMQSSDTKEYLQLLVIDPFLKYIMNRIFPYMLIVLCLFGVLIIFVVLTFVLLLVRAPTPTRMGRCGSCGGCGSVPTS